MFKKMTSLLLSGTVAASAVLTGCSDNLQQNNAINVDSSKKSSSTVNNVSSRSYDAETTNNTCTVNLGREADITGDGAWFEGNVLTISEGGEYRLSGSIEDGYIYVDTDENVKLIFNGINVSNSKGAALYCYDAKNLYIELEEGSENVFTDSTLYMFEGKNESVSENEPNAAIYSKSDLIISGSGSLEVNGKYDTGIRCNDDLEIIGGSITVNAVDHGIRGSDSVTVSGGNIDVTAGNDGIKSTNSEEADKGYIAVDGGSITINSTDNCIKAAGRITVTDGELNLSSEDGKGISAEGDLLIENGKIDILKSTEGLESKALFTVNGGEISIQASDDGLNSGGGSDSNFFGGGDISDETHNMTINGGYIYVNASGDGIDSNGDITINGGTIIVNGPTSGGDGALDSGDFGNKITVNGGTLIAVGSRQMAELPDSGSAQNCLCASVSMNAGETLTIRDSSGSDIAVFTAAKQVQHVIFSSPDIKQGETYSFYTGVTAEGENKGGLYSDDVKVSNAGEPVCSLIADSAVTSDGNGGFGGFGGFGGGRGDFDGNNFGGEHGGFGGHGRNENNGNGDFTPPDNGMNTLPDGEAPALPDIGMNTPPDGEAISPPDGEMRIPPENGSNMPDGGEMTPPSSDNA